MISQNITPSVVLGIEGGGTHTVALWTDTAGREIRRQELGCGNVRLLSETALRTLFEAICQAGQDLSIESICAGMAGAVDQADRDRVLAIGQSVFGPKFREVCNDLQTPLSAAKIPEGTFPVLVLCGTGSCCYAENSEGTLHAKSGGWGHLLGDRGSAYRVGLEALRGVLSVLDSTGKLPPLGERLLSFQLLNTPADWLDWALHAAKRDIASQARIVCECAQKGDQLSLEILSAAARELSGDALSCARKYLLLSSSSLSPFFLLSGGMLKNSSLYRNLVAEQIQKQYPSSQVSVLETESIWGAVKRALKHLSLPALEPTSPRAVETLIPTSAAAASPTEERNPRSMNLDQLSIEAAVQLMIDEEEYVQKAIQTQKPLIVQLVRKVSEAFQKGGRLFYAGAGTSGRLGVLDASECPPTFGVSYEQVQGIIAGGYEALWRAAEGAEDSPQAGAEAVLSRGIHPQDVVIGIAASGTTPFVRGVLSQARMLGATTALLCFNPNRKPYPENEPDIVLAVPTGPELLTGSTRLKSGTATKLILNMITTLSMVQTGKVMSNLMVDVRASNDKLRDRAIRILSQLTQWPRAQAQEALEQNHWSIRQALEQNSNRK